MLLMLAFASEALAWKPILIGHRGSRTGVENTEQAFINGVTKHGCQALECDVKVTSDKKYVCWHDDIISGFGLSSNCTIYSTTLATLQSKTLTQTRKSVKYTGKITTVDRYLEICKQYNVIPVVELKWAVGINSNDMSNFPGLYALIQKHGLVDKTIILTSMKASLEYVTKNYPKLQCQYLVNYMTSSNISTCKSNGWDISSCYYYNSSNYVTQALVNSAHSAGVKVSLWTMNSETDYKKYCGYGANYVTSDDFIYKNLPELSGTNPNPEPEPEIPDVEWELNGGKVIGGTVPTNQELWEQFMPAYNTYYSLNRATQDITAVATFANAQMEDFMTNTKSDWKWLGDYIKTVAGEISGESAWRWHVHAFFNCNDGTVQGNQKVATADFSTAGKPAKWGPAYQYAMGSGATLPTKITSTYTIPTPVKEGYKFLGWYNTNNTSGTKYTTLSAGFKGKLYAIWQLEEVDVTWVLNGGKVSGTLPTKITATYTIPTPTKTGSIFLGWYSTNNTSGTKYTTLAAGFKGTVYAIWREATVAWTLNGGKVYEMKTSGGTVTVPTQEQLWESYKTAGGLTTLGTLAEIKAAGEGKPHNDPENQCACRIICAKLTSAVVEAVFAKADWAWLKTYIVGVQPALADLALSDATWRYAIAAFFLQSQHSAYPTTENFATAGQPSAWGPAYQKAHGNDATGGTTTKVEVTLPTKITSTYTLPSTSAGYIFEKDGSTFVGWYDNNSGTGTALTTLPAYYDGTVYAIWKSNEPTDVTWELNGGTVSVTLPTKIEGSAYTLPTPTKTGYVFLGWYDNAAGTGTALKTLPVGYKGTVYAIWREAKITWVLNGGKVYEIKTTTTGGGASDVVVPTNDSLWQAFKPYYNTYYNLSRADQPITSVSLFAAALMYKIMTDPASEYKWLGDYVNSVATAQGFTLGEDEALWRWHVHSFFNCNKHEEWPVTADFTEAGKPEKWGPAYQAAHGGSTGGTTTTTKVEVTLPSKVTAPYTIPTPEKEGATFLGWYDTNNTTGNKLTVLPAYYDGTIYAVWNDTPTNVEQVVRPALDLNAPMYDIMGRQVDETYRGIIIQNGNKYLLR